MQIEIIIQEIEKRKEILSNKINELFNQINNDLQSNNLDWGLMIHKNEFVKFIEKLITFDYDYEIPFDIFYNKSKESNNENIDLSKLKNSKLLDLYRQKESEINNLIVKKKKEIKEILNKEGLKAIILIRQNEKPQQIIKLCNMFAQFNDKNILILKPIIIEK